MVARIKRLAGKIKKTNNRAPSPVEVALRGLQVGETIKIEGSVSYWRNHQARLHKENPDLWIRVYNTENGPVADRLA